MSKAPFDSVVVAHGATVLRVVRAVVGPADADDAWSETFLAALRAYPDLDDGANLEAWLVTIAHRKAIDIARARARRAAVLDRIHEPAHGRGDPGERDDARELWDAVLELPAKRRQCVAYHYLGGLPYEEVAAIVGGSVDAARRASADGVRTLRRAYAVTDQRSEDQP